MADDLGDDDYYLQEEIPPENNDTTDKTVKTKKKKQKVLPKRPLGTYSDLITTIRIHYKKSKSQYELDELLSIFNSSISASSPSTSTISLDEYLNELVLINKWSK
ncbi:unnamed protein product, partial [Rotaria sp. Silwood2]